MVAHLKKGDIVQANISHAGSDTDKTELAFERGEKFKMLSDGGDESYWNVQSLTSKKKGFVPSNAVHKEGSLDLHAWCHGAINRSAAEFLLVRSDTPGSYLVRESQSKPGDYTLSLYDGKVAHYRINESGGQFFIRQKQTFGSIPELIQHHQEHHSGLPLKLMHIVVKAHAKGIVISKKDEETWEMKRSEIKLGKMLGAGNYGEVYKASWRKTDVAVKTVKEDSMGIDEFMREAAVMKMMKHPNLVMLIGVCSDEIPMYIVTELLPHGDLLTYLRQPKSAKEFDQKAILYVCSQVADGMAYLEGKNCIHRDLACRNCLVADKLVIKIADFGMGRVIDDLYTARTGSKMPVKWSAPESLCYNAFSSASDVWSFGILLWEVVMLGASPYPDIDSKDVLTKLEDGYRMPRPKKCSESMYELMFNCWKMRSEERPTFKTLKDGFEALLDEASGGSSKKAPQAKASMATDWREGYEKSSGGLTITRLQEMIDLTKQVYAKASTIVRYGEEAKIKKDVSELVSTCATFLQDVDDLLATYPAIKRAKQMMQMAYDSLVKGGSMTMAKAKPHVEKLRNATRDMNKNLKQIKV